MVKCQLLKDIIRVEGTMMRSYKAGDIIDFSQSDAERLASRGTLIILQEPEPEPKPKKKVI
jgi:hypothetical protein